MVKDQWIAADEFCSYYQIEYAFVHTLHQSGLVHLEQSEDRGFIPIDEIQEVEKFARLHYELEINIEGIEAIAHLLKRIKEMQHEIAALKRSGQTNQDSLLFNPDIHQTPSPI